MLTFLPEVERMKGNSQSHSVTTIATPACVYIGVERMPYTRINRNAQCFNVFFLSLALTIPLFNTVLFSFGKLSVFLTV